MPDDAPQVIPQRTVPKADATGVQIGALPQIVFTEPVKGVPAGVMLSEEGGGTIGLTISGVGPDGPIETLAEASADPSCGSAWVLRFTAEGGYRG